MQNACARELIGRNIFSAICGNCVGCVWITIVRVAQRGMPVASREPIDRFLFKKYGCSDNEEVEYKHAFCHTTFKGVLLCRTYK